MNFKDFTYYTLILGLSILVTGCTEPFEFEAPVFESSVVIEATITNENKNQKILISRSSPLDTILSIPERGASVNVIDATGASFGFQDNHDGSYSSTTPFAAQENMAYTLTISTSDGNSYRSEPSSIRASSEIDAIYPVREFKDDIEEGVTIYLDSFNPSNTSNYYRYEYEETHQIIAPFYTGFEAFIISRSNPEQVGFRGSTDKGFICYQTNSSRTIIQTSTLDLSEDRVIRFPIRFINRENYILSNRYSILVKQFVQSLEAFTYYETLNTLSGSENFFSQVQPGFLEGNLRSEQSESEKVIGFFEVASVSEQRLFFSYEDLFPGESLPEFIIDCTLISPELVRPGPTFPLFDVIDLGLADFFAEYDVLANPLGFGRFGPFLMTPSGCGDCTQFGSKTVPDFWEEEN